MAFELLSLRWDWQMRKTKNKMAANKMATVAFKQVPFCDFVTVSHWAADFTTFCVNSSTNFFFFLIKNVSNENKITKDFANFNWFAFSAIQLFDGSTWLFNQWDCYYSINYEFQFFYLALVCCVICRMVPPCRPMMAPTISLATSTLKLIQTSID